MEEARNAFICSDGEEDRISRLPDELIHHIMSFMDTNYAVKTSLLSKRWIHVWKSLPFLNFERWLGSYDNTRRFVREYENTERFVEFVYFVFISRYDAPIQKFTVEWQDSEKDDKVIMNLNRWIVFAVKRDVQEESIGIGLWGKCAFEIPYALLNCKSLRALDITVYEAGAYIILPTSMNLPRLKVLHLHGLSFSGVDLSEKLLSSCPVLETLGIGECEMLTDNHGNLIVTSATLKEFECNWFLDDSTPDVIKLCAPNLEKFTLEYPLENCSSLSWLHFENCSSLSWVHFDIILDLNFKEAQNFLRLPSMEKDVYAKRMMKHLGEVSAVKQMKLSPVFLELLSQAPDLLDCQPPRLCNLQRLVLDMWSTRGCLLGIAYLLKISPHLTYLSLRRGWELPPPTKETDAKKERCDWESNSANVDDDWETGLSSRGMLAHLKYVQIKRVKCCDAELKLLIFLLKNAADLEEVSVYFHFSVGSPDKVIQVEQFKDKLRGVPTASSSIQLVFQTGSELD